MPTFAVLRHSTQLLLDNGGLTVFHDLDQARDAAFRICTLNNSVTEVLEVVARFKPHALEVPVE